VMDHIHVQLQKQEGLENAVHQFKDYICSEILADRLDMVDKLNGEAETVEIPTHIGEDIQTKLDLQKNG
jgi:hypothetical protein